MNKMKERYCSPTIIPYAVRFEANLMTSPDGYHNGGGGSYTPGDDINDNGDY